MKYAGLKKYRWLFFALAAIGLIQTPAAILKAIALVSTDHSMILVMILALAIRFTFIGFFLKIWWETRPAAGVSDSRPGLAG